MHLLKEYKIFISKVKKGGEASDQSIAYERCSLSKKTQSSQLFVQNVAFYK